MHRGTYINILLAFFLGNCTNSNPKSNLRKFDTLKLDYKEVLSFKKIQNKKSVYPFDKADSIVCYAYPATSGGAIINGTLIRDGKFLVTKIYQRITLDSNAREALFSTLYEFNSVDMSGNDMASTCYVPRHSIAFYRKDSAIEYLEICFECHEVRHSNKVNFGFFSYSKLELLHNFLQSIGMHKGLGKIHYDIP